jgi:Thiamine pyrophosphate enzyme, N-terminal TPP binding domain
VQLWLRQGLELLRKSQKSRFVPHIAPGRRLLSRLTIFCALPLTGTKVPRMFVVPFEGGAVYMADGYARVSDEPGACFGTGRPEYPRRG